jgi:hypothetical protein
MEIEGNVGSGCGRCWTVIQFCNTLLVLILTGVVIFIGMQMQMLNYKMTDQELEIETLKVQVQQKQEGQIQELHQAVEQEHNLTLGTLAGTFTLLTCLISMFHMSSHLQKYNEPIIQRKIIAILWMSPIYSVTSFLSLIWPPTESYLSILKDFYEAYCIYTFLSFLIAVLGRGDRDVAVQVLAKHADHMDKPNRFLRRWYNPPPETSDEAMASAVMTECQLLAMQFVFCRPFTSIANFVINYLAEAQERDNAYQDTTQNDSYQSDPYLNNNTLWNDNDNVNDATNTNNNLNGIITNKSALHSHNVSSAISDPQQFQEATKTYFTSPSFVIAMIVNVSIFFAFMGLLKFYHAVREDLAWCQPWPKFLTIKGVVFLTFWQGLAISMAVNFKHEEQHTDTDPLERASQLQNMLICLEMLFFSITHWCVFPAEEWEKDYTPRINQPKAGIGIQDFVQDVSQIVKASRRRKAPGKNSRGHGVYQDAPVLGMSEDEEAALGGDLPPLGGRIPVETAAACVETQAEAVVVLSDDEDL